MGSLISMLMRYPGGNASRARVLQCLGEVEMSHVSPKYVVLEGTFNGKLEAGVPWANDFILQDETGYLACLYRQPWAIFEGLFGLLYADLLIGRPVRVYGWYRRFNAPFLEIDGFQMLDTGETKRCYFRIWTIVLHVLGVAGMATMLAFMLRPG